ncbi:hypothetical protein NQ314_018687 [Rhamnusium bicolor]|uniref:Uncharacterized protein n=1 Tax=Rhamnusium bicolor TaxID=1586634 RepID=A0AAV8WRB8_9CUCU|nr:hypothetical protein NQ314_018687 [Rhamnusium bicolor]
MSLSRNLYKLSTALGKPAELTDELNPDWAPSVNMGYDKTLNANRMERFERKRKRLAEARVIEVLLVTFTL